MDPKNRCRQSRDGKRCGGGVHYTLNPDLIMRRFKPVVESEGACDVCHTRHRIIANNTNSGVSVVVEKIEDEAAAVSQADGEEGEAGQEDDEESSRPS